LNILFPETFRNIQFQLYNNRGAIEYETTIENNSSNNIQVQLPSITSGVYYCHIKAGNKNVMEKLVIIGLGNPY
jgi:hypothetical protein